MTESETPSFETRRVSLTRAVGSLQAAINRPPDPSKEMVVETAAATTNSAAQAFIDSALEVSAHAADLERRLATVREALESLSVRDELGTGLRNDGIAFRRLFAGLFVFGLISWATSHRIWWGFIAAADLDVLLVLLAVGFHGDTMYAPNREPLKKHWITKWLYGLVPSKAAAIAFVALLFGILWFSFGMLYTGYPLKGEPTSPGFSMTTSNERIEMTSTAPGADKNTKSLQRGEALTLSFLTLATFEGPNDEYPPELRWTVVLELVSAVFLVLGVFGLAINRLSDFD